ncbi:hypothetical protein K1T73_10635 [Roseovarius sp. SCSIO 43702]|nr:hypothetical protein K1T73_10635 [Roseovarius sp. SCSIO 43702]
MMLGAAAGAETPERIALPSGGEAWVQEVRAEPEGYGPSYRFRYVQEGFEMNEARFAAVMADLEHLCARHVAPWLLARAPGPQEVVVSLASAPGQFGVADPQIAQVFETYLVENGACIWEEF